MFRIRAALAALALAAICQLGTAQDQIATRQGERIVLFPLKRAAIAAEVDATVKSFPLKDGSAILKGDVLAELDSRIYFENLRKAEAAVKEAEANAVYAAKAYEQAEGLLSKGGIGRQEFEKAKLDKDGSEARLKFAEASCQAALISFESCKVKAPYPGHLLRRIASEGEYVKAGQPLLEAANDLELLAVANLPSSEAAGLKLGETAKFRIDETRAEATGTLYEISGAVNPAGRSIEVKYLIDNRDGKLLPGMSGAIVSRKGAESK